MLIPLIIYHLRPGADKVDEHVTLVKCASPAEAKRKKEWKK
jgi:hypothetical protein